MKIDCAYDKLVEIHKLVPNPKNNNRHSIEQIERLAKIIDYQGMRQPIVVSNRSGYITKGHCRLSAIKVLGWEQAPVDYQDYENEAQEYSDMTADNEIARWAEFDRHMLYTDIKDIPDLDIEMLGLPDDFEIPSIETDEEREEREDDVPEVDEEKPPITQKGDLWLLGAYYECEDCKKQYTLAEGEAIEECSCG